MYGLINDSIRRLVIRDAGEEAWERVVDRAAAAYQAIIADYPGSPLVADAKKAVEDIKATVGAQSIFVREDIAEVSVIGVGMRTHYGVAEKMFGALANARINIDSITTSEIRISCIVDKTEGEKALKAAGKIRLEGKDYVVIVQCHIVKERCPGYNPIQNYVQPSKYLSLLFQHTLPLISPYLSFCIIRHCEEALFSCWPTKQSQNMS